MRLASSGGIGFYEKQVFRLFRLRKRVHQRLTYVPGVDKTVVFIVGCQRSGTSMLHHLMRMDRDTVTYDEISPLSSDDRFEGLRWNELSEVRDRILTDRAPLVVTKPLVESQNLGALLDLMPDTRAVWMYRHFADVAASNVKHFGEATGRSDLEPIVAGDASNWRAENLAEADREAILELHHENLAPHDAAALFWYARNSLFFGGGYAVDDRVRTCRYEDLVAKPAVVMGDLYEFLGRPYPGDRIVRDVLPGLGGKGQAIELEPAVRSLCEGLLDRLDETGRLGRDGGGKGERGD